MVRIGSCRGRSVGAQGGLESWGLGGATARRLDFILGQSAGVGVGSGRGYSSRTDQPERRLLLRACCSLAPEGDWSAWAGPQILDVSIQASPRPPISPSPPRGMATLQAACPAPSIRTSVSHQNSHSDSTRYAPVHCAEGGDCVSHPVIPQHPHPNVAWWELPRPGQPEVRSRWR